MHIKMKDQTIGLSTSVPTTSMMALFIALFLMTSCQKSSSTASTTLGDWKRGSEYEGVGRTEAVSFIIGNNIYVGGGFDGTNRLNDFWMFDQTTQSWVRKADFPGVARNSAVGFSVKGKGYVGTGYDANNNKLSDFWEYDPATNIWTRKADFAGSPRYNAVGFAILDKGYITTGYDGSFLKDLWEYDPSGDQWTQKASLTGSKRSEAVAFVYNNKAYVVTGINNGSYLNDFWSYDPTSNSWTELRKITNVSTESYDDLYGTNNITRSNASIFVMNDKAYLTCGNRSGVFGTTWEYNIANDVWTQKTGFEGSAREGAIGFNLNNRGYLLSGGNSSFCFDDLWEFIPDVPVDVNDN
jgi:N-acetylneuraminic acid mutarotase